MKLAFLCAALVMAPAFADDLVARRPFGSLPGGLWDRQGKHWLIIDVDGTRTGGTTAGTSSDTRPSCPSPPF